MNCCNDTLKLPCNIGNNSKKLYCSKSLYKAMQKEPDAPYFTDAEINNADKNGFMINRLGIDWYLTDVIRDNILNNYLKQ